MNGCGSLYLCLDQGGSSSRALVFDETGVCIASGQQPVGTARSRSGRVEQDPRAVVDSMVAAIGEVLEQMAAADFERLRAAGLATQRSSMVCWHRSNGEPITPVISWQDTRAAHWLEAQQWPAKDVHQRTGLMPSAHFGVSKMRWCLDHVSEVKKAAATGDLVIGPLASYLITRLTGTRTARVDPANASRTLLMNLETLDWDETLLQRANIPRRWLPAIFPTVYEFGELSVAGCRLPLRLVNGDQSSAVYAAGLPERTRRYVNVGTGAFVYQPVDLPVRDIALLSSITFHNITSDYVLEGTVNGAGSAVSQFAEERSIFNLENAMDKALSIEDCQTVFLNGIGGLGSPDWRPDFNSRFIGKGNESEQLRAILESILFLLLRNMKVMDDAGLRAEGLIISGGMSASDGFCQLLSDLSRLAVLRPTNPEATARGTAFLLAGRPCNWEILPTTCFTPRHNSQLDARYRYWQRAMEGALAQGTPNNLP